MIQIENLSFKYSGSDLDSISSINLNIAEGECVLICGESGCGKSTLMKAVNGLIPHYYEDGNLKGSVKCCGLDVASTPLEKLSDNIGSVFQNPRSQFFCVDTTGELAFGCENQGIDPQNITERISDVVDTMNLDSLMERNIFALSGGEKQKIACASISVMRPDVYVLDEPTSNLDQDGIDMLGEVLRIWKSEGKTIIVAEHRLGWLKGIADRVVIIRDGIIDLEYSANEFWNKKTDELNAHGLRAFNTKKNFTDYKTGFYPLDGDMQNCEPDDECGDKVYRFSDFRYSYKKGKNVLNIDKLVVQPHSVVAVIGHNGVGKSTFSKCLCGLMKGFKGYVTRGSKRFKGRKLIDLSYMVMQDVNHQLFTDSCLEEVMISMEEDDREAALQVLDKMDLGKYADVHPMSLSGGQKQRLAICQAYVSKREIIVFDEPTSGLDYKHMRKTAELIKEISKDKTIFVITHDMELVEACCSHVLNLG